MESPIRSGIAECVAEGMSAGMGPREIARHYGLNPTTVGFYVWATRYPDRFLALRERVRKSMRAKTKARGVASGWQPANLRRERWSAEDVQRLRQLVQAQYSFAEIARFMNRSRCSIAGKVARLKKSSTPA